MTTRNVLFTAVLLLTGGTVAQAQDNGAGAFGAQLADAEGHWQLLDRYCTECHNFEDWAGGVAFDTMAPEFVPDDPAVWEHTVRKLRGRLMPPPGNPQPAQADINGFVSWMEGYLDEVIAQDPNPGHVPLHRMNRSEYRHAVRDLLAVDVEVSDLLPSEVRTEGFDNIASSLRVSPTFLDQYILAARHVSRLAVGDPSPEPASTVYNASGANQAFHVDGLPLGTRGGLVFEHQFPADGEYVFNVLGLGFGMEYGHTLILTIDGERVFEASLGGEDDQRVLDQQQAAAREALNRRFRNIRVDVAGGQREVGVTFLAKSLAESDAHLHSFTPGGGMDRIPRVGGVEVVGPYRAQGVADTPSRERIFTCYPQAQAEERPCAERIVSTIAARAFRGRFDDQDREQLMRYYDSGRAASDFEGGVQRALMATLASPKFLYRAAELPEGASAGETWPLDSLELASRLSFFLWSQGPDQELIDLALAGGLDDPDAIAAQVRRMLADERSMALVTNFAFNWLGLGEMHAVNPDPNLFPHFNRGLRDAFEREMVLFLDSVMRADRSVVELLTAGHTFLNEQLALHYGVPGVRGDRFRRVELDDENRWGLFGKGAVLLATSFGNRTSPVVRGDWILHNIMGTPPAPPPPGVETDLSEPADGERMTVRQLLEEHRENPSCNACHGVMDPLGLALENFDVTGEWRDLDRYARLAIDAGGQLADGTPIAGPVQLREALARNPDQFVQALTEKLLMYGLGRTLRYYDMPVVRRIVREAAGDDYTLSAILIGVATSEPFRMRRIPDGDDVPLGNGVAADRADRD